MRVPWKVGQPKCPTPVDPKGRQPVRRKLFGNVRGRNTGYLHFKLPENHLNAKRPQAATDFGPPPCIAFWPTSGTRHKLDHALGLRNSGFEGLGLVG